MIITDKVRLICLSIMLENPISTRLHPCFDYAFNIALLPSSTLPPSGPTSSWDLSEPEADGGRPLITARPLLHRDVLANESRYLVRLLSLQPRDALLHQVAALHVEVQCALLGLYLARRYHLRVWIVIKCFLQQ
jgi:hypothetical protein